MQSTVVGVGVGVIVVVGVIDQGQVTFRKKSAQKFRPLDGLPRRLLKDCQTFEDNLPAIRKETKNFFRVVIVGLVHDLGEVQVEVGGF